MSFVKVLLSRPEDDLDISTAQEDVAVAEARMCGCGPNEAEGRKGAGEHVAIVERHDGRWGESRVEWRGKELGVFIVHTSAQTQRKRR